MRWDDSFQFHLFTTNACNLKCVYCALPDKGKQLPEYDISDFVRVLDESSFKQKQIVFAFMEPTLNIPFIEEIIDKTKSIKGVEYVMQTNGTRLHKVPKDILDQFSLLFVSVDGDAHTHNQQRGKNFNLIMENVMNIKNSFPGKIETAITVTDKVNIYTSVLGLMNIFDSVTWQLVEDENSITQKFMDDYQNQFKKLVDYWIISAEAEVYYDFVPITGFLDIIANNKPYPYSNCGIGKNISVISYDGTAYSCPVAMKKVKRGEESPEIHILGNIREGIVPREYNLESKCFDQQCSAKEFCRGRCNWYHIDNPKGAKKYCETTRFMIKTLKAISEELNSQQKKKLSEITTSIVHDYTNIMP